MLYIQKRSKPNGKYHIFESLTTLCGMRYEDLTDYDLLPDNKSGYLCPLCKKKNLSQPSIMLRSKYVKLKGATK
jgi:hypothetical protein